MGCRGMNPDQRQSFTRRLGYFTFDLLSLFRLLGRMSRSKTKQRRSTMRRWRIQDAVGILLFSSLFLQSSALTDRVQEPMSFEMHPSAQLRFDEDRRRDLRELPESWFDSSTNAVYATLPKAENLQDDTVPRHHRRALEDFHIHRHLSRYELQHRLENDLTLDSDWDGFYRLDSDIAHGEFNGTSATESDNDRSRRRLRKNLKPHDPYQAAPLSQGYGTHYAHVWVGSPIPQRKSVIVDTGSHYTAFPCRGCKGCGEEHHTDPYYDFSRSNTFRSLPCTECKLGASCHRDQCLFSQSYTEGSSWDAFQAQDMFYCGGNNVLASADSASQQFSVPFLFGCQTAETGLFVTQLADGIMGMSAHDFTLPKQMYDAGRLEHNMFSLCFRRELATSKRGVTAGFMTLGGVDSRLDRSPMVYARNIASSGWFTVFVKNIFIRSNGGQSATNIPEQDQHILKIPLDLTVVNSGKGVIVDSGTTDTYLHKNLAKSFISVWKQVTGKEYTHSGITLTSAQLSQLPTILIQCQSAHRYGPTVGSLDGVVGLAGRLDPSSPHDLLIAIPATNYMEYSPSTNQYTSRLYFTETRGGVLGANAMQGHNVVFDWQNGQIGFSESTCEYREDDAFPDSVKELNRQRVGHDCLLGMPMLQHACVDSVDLNECQQDPNQTLKGFEQWTRVIKQSGTETGMSCTEAGILGTNYNGPDPPSIECNGEGLCTEVRPCQFHCALASTSARENILETADTSPTDTEEGCDDDWSACDRSCTQSRVVSQLRSDGLCHEKRRTRRACHTGACGEYDRCFVPFFVHSIIGLKGADLSNWTRKAEEWLSVAIVNTIRRLSGEQFGRLFTAGDIDIMMTSPWVSEETLQDAAENMSTRVVFQISVFNPQASHSDNAMPAENGKSSPVPSGRRWLQVVTSWGERLWQSNFRRKTTCAEGDLYPQALQAMKLHDLIERPTFISSLITELRLIEQEDPRPPPSPFHQLYENDQLVSQSQVISAWTIRSEDLDEPVPTGEHPFLIHTKKIRQYANRSPFTMVMTGIFLAIFLVSTCFGSYDVFVMKYFFWTKETEDDGSAASRGSSDGEADKLLPTRVLSMDDSSENSIDELFEQLVSKGSPKRASPRRRGSLDSWATSSPSGDLELTPSGSRDRKRA